MGRNRGTSATPGMGRVRVNALLMKMSPQLTFSTLHVNLKASFFVQFQFTRYVNDAQRLSYAGCSPCTPFSPRIVLFSLMPRNVGNC